VGIPLNAPLRAEEPPSIGNLLHGLVPGKTVEVPDGTYTTQWYRVIQGLRGTEEQPIIFRAAHRRKAVVVGEAGLVLRDCEHAADSAT